MPSLSASTAVHLTVLLVCFATFISTLELLCRRQWLSDDQLLSWPVSRLRYSWLAVGVLGGAADRFLRSAVFIWLMYLRLALAVITPFTEARTSGFLLLTLTFLYGAWSLRSPYGQDGSDQMMLVITLTLAVTHLAGTAVAWSIGIWFLTAQLCLSYFVAGSAKAISPIWRSGEALELIFKTTMYGHPLAYRSLKGRRRLSQLSCWFVITLETMFPIVLIAPLPVAGTVMGLMALFHLITAVVMGLNTFFLAFLAAYPCLLYVILL
jgi:hypothetical protein